MSVDRTWRISPSESVPFVASVALLRASAAQSSIRSTALRVCWMMRGPPNCSVDAVTCSRKETTSAGLIKGHIAFKSDPFGGFLGGVSSG